jgi:hypothetical protein
MFVALMDSEHYHWLGAGETEEQARDAIERAWAQHMLRVAQDDPGVLDDAVLPEDLANWYGIRTYEVRPGDAYLDDQRIVSATEDPLIARERFSTTWEERRSDREGI